MNDATRVASFLEDLTAWADSRSDVVAVALVGSHARGTPRADSDIDLVILRDAALLIEGDWPSHFGDVTSRKVEDYGALTSVRVFYRDGLEVEFGFAEPSWAAVPLDPGTQSVLADGVRILYDPQGLLASAKHAAFS